MRDFVSNRLKPRRPAFSLLEVLIAATLSLLIMAALAQAFKRLNEAVSEGKTRLVLSDKLRNLTAIIRGDLERMTTRPIPPLSANAPTGYFEYFDGPLTDYSATIYNPTNNASSASISEQIPTSRYGDTDDILMFTARAGDAWFKGKVPVALLKAVENYRLLQGSTTQFTNFAQLLDATALGGTRIFPADWVNMVVISSEYAEIVYFMLPVSVLDETGTPFVLDANNDGIPDLGYNLHRRVLLIRPDLNIPDPVSQRDTLFYVDPSAIPPATQIMSIPGSNNALAMATAHNNCDLSLRRVVSNNPLFNNSAWSGQYPVAANSLDDLTRPENRFAHWQMRVMQASTTMPLLALQPPTPMQRLTVAFGLPNDHVGYLRPEFALSGRSGERIGEDVLASNVIGFDVRGFDPSVRLLYHGGQDLQPGRGQFDDDGANGPDDANEYGVSGSDDLILSPSDPGYGYAMINPIVNPRNPGAVAGYGAFVDLCWGPKVLSLSSPFGPFQRNNTNATNAVHWASHLSGYSPNNRAPNGVDIFSNQLFQSGKLVRPSDSVLIPTIYQPTYDSWTSAYESDGKLQDRRLGNTGFLGTFWINRIKDFDQSQPNTTDNPNGVAADIGTNGVDDNRMNGPDDTSEQETRPPFDFAIPSIQIQVRIQDSSKGLFSQMSVIQDFVSQ